MNVFFGLNILSLNNYYESNIKFLKGKILNFRISQQMILE